MPLARGSQGGHRLNVGADERNVWLAWVLAGVVAGLLALAIAAETPPFLVGVLPSGDEQNTSGWTMGNWAILLAGALAGATFGAIQRLVLRRVLPHLDGWVWVSTAGFGMAFTAVWALGGGQHGAVAHHALPHAVDLAGPLGGAIIGAALGASQWLILRRYLPRAGWWVPFNGVGLAAGWLLAAATPVDGVPAHFVGSSVVGLALAAITGAALVWLLEGAKVATQRRQRGYVLG
jgi:hypothetical protein